MDAEPTAPVTPVDQPPKKKHGCLIGCLTVFGVLVLVVVGVLGWLGLVPGLSRLIGPEPRDLGVEFSTEEAYTCAEAFNIPDTFADLQAILDDPTAFTTFDASLTSEQASSLLLMGQDDIPNWPFEFVQLRFNDDGTAEASGILDLDDLRPFLTQNLGVPIGGMEEAISRVQLVDDVPFYVMGSCGVRDNVMSLSLSEIQLGRFTVPEDWYQGREQVGADYISAVLVSEGFDIETIDVSGGTVQAKGTRPLSSLIPWLGIVRDDRAEE